jgi:phospholipid/cholesterol/gamma-HCH transport system substrate-binding protein
MENKAHALAAGAFVLLVSALLVAMAWWLSREGGVRVAYELSSRDSVSGLNLQAAVRFKGVQVGKVTAISFDPKVPGNVLVRISVDTNAPVTQATFATLGYQGVTGIAHVQLDDGPGPKTPLVSLTAILRAFPCARA